MKPWLKAVLILAAVATGIAALFFWESKRGAAMTGEAEATVTKVTFVRDTESSSLDSTDIRYAFDANGVRTESSDSLPGDKVEAYDRPEDPDLLQSGKADRHHYADRRGQMQRLSAPIARLPRLR